KTLAGLNEAIGNMRRHLVEGGVLIVEPWLSPETFRPGEVNSLFVDRPEFKIARLDISALRGRLSMFRWHLLIGTPGGIEYLTQKHELALFTELEYRAALEKAGLTVLHDEKGLMNRGLYIGVAPAA